LNNKSYLNLERKYKNRQGVNIGQELIAPCLAGEPKLYRRGTAYFSSSSMKAYAESMSKLIEKKVKFEIICSPVIQDKGLIEILESNSTKEKKEINVLKLAENIMLDAVGFEKNKENVSYRSKVLSYLIASGRLEIKFAIPKAIEKLITEISYEDLYHVKNGYFVFDNGDEVAFEGSFNESEGGHSKNIESTLVFRSWESGDLERLEDTKQEIDGDWNEEEGSKDLKIYPLGDEILEKIKRIASKTPPIKPDPPPPILPPNPDPVDDDLPYDLMPHQNTALEKWRENNYKGILALATGSGKTITAIHQAVTMAEKETLCVIIAVPYIVLAEQWVEVLNEYGVVPYECFGNSKKWYSKLENAIGRFNLNIKKFLPIIVVNATLNGTKFQSQLKKIENSLHGEILMISDECHHHANRNIIKKLPKAKYIMGLSATPWNPGDKESESILKSYYVDEVYTYSLQQALDDDRLCQYTYNIHEVELNADEEEEYLRLTKIISVLYKQKETGLSPEKQSMLDNTIFKRSRLLDGIEDKFDVLDNLLKEKRPSPYKLFYCGSGFQASYDDEEDLHIEKDSISIIDRINKILSNRGWDVSKFTSEESHSERRNVLKTFKSKKINAIAAIKVLDEGFDVPMCDEAYFTASSSSERQWVQRRGRILRKSDNKEIAVVHDFVITKTSSTSDFKELINREMARVNAFFNSCSNQEQIEGQIKGIKEAYSIEEQKEN